MKRLYFILLTIGAALLGLQQIASAQDQGIVVVPDDQVKEALKSYTKSSAPSPEGISFNKVISQPDDNGVYNIFLQAFVEGEKISVKKSIPSDIVLVLDVSNSMINTNNNITSVTYNEIGTASTEWSYSGYGNSTYYYLDTDGEYCRVQRSNERLNGGGSPRRYNLYYTKTSTGNTRYYLSNSSGISTTRPTDIDNQNTTIWTGQLYNRTQSSITRLKALQDAVGEFLETIHNDDVKDPNNPLGHQVSIVKFSGPYVGGSADAAMTPGNNPGGANVPSTEVFKGWTSMSDASVVETLKSDVNNINTGNGTAIDFGMVLAQKLLATSTPSTTDKPRSKTVVVFTDGAPSHYAMGDGMGEGDIADAAINTANDIKGIKAYSVTVDGVTTDVYTKVFTVGMLGANPSGTALQVLQRSSSNYEGATSRTTGTEVSTAYYFLADDAESLRAAFAEIGASSGGASYSMDSETTAMVDIVSKSFMLPANADVNSIAVWTAECEGVYTGGELNGLLKFSDTWEDGRAQGLDVDLSADRQEVTVTNFDYSANWCGKEVSANGLITYRGKKIILGIPVQMATNAVGGKDMQTNADGSGIIVNGDNILPFISPEVSLPVNIWIRKEGLLEGESAKFTIQRAVKPESWNEEDFDYPTASNDTRYDALDWEDVSSVFVTRHKNQPQTGENAPVTKAMGLPSVNESDEEFIYRIVENADWSWSYSSTAPTIFTSDLLETNPFIFTNSKKANIDVEIRHAESKATNTFKTDGGDKYDDSKNNNRNVITFTPPTTVEEE